MQPVVQAVLRSWSIPVAATFALVLTALIYMRGAWLLRRAGYPNLPGWRIASFALGLFAVWFALASPLDTFSTFVITAHMLQHMTLMMVAPPLLLLGEPLIPILRGMPRFAAREFAGPFLNWKVTARIGLFLTKPVTALVLMGAVMFIWHVPGPYELAVRSGAWHQFEHACFFFVSIIFWWPVVQPWPSRPQWPRWAMVPYLVIADLQNTVLSAVLVFSDRLLYPSYGAGPGLFRLSAQEDQAAAGAIMWVVGSLAFLVPATLIAVQCLTRRSAVRTAVEATRPVLYRAKVDEATIETRLAAWLGDRVSSRMVEAASFIVLFAAVSAGFMLLVKPGPDEDDQVLRGSQQAGPFAIALYGPEGTIPTGPVSFAVLAKDAKSREVLLDTAVGLSLRKNGSARADAKPVPAEVGDENRLLFSGEVDIETAGSWSLDVNVHRGSEEATASFPVEAVQPEPELLPRWPYLVFPSLAVVMAITYLFRHRTVRHADLAASAP